MAGTLQVGGSTLATHAGSALSIHSGVTFPAGHILQVQNFFTNSELTCTCAANQYTDLGTFNVSITPTSSSNKIVVMLSIGGWNFSSTNYGLGHTGVFRRKIGSGSFASIGAGTGNTNFNGSFFLSQTNSTYYHLTVNKTFLDSPNTTSECTYGIAVADHNNSTQTFYLNAHGGGSGDYPYLAKTCSSIIAMEIKA